MAEREALHCLGTVAKLFVICTVGLTPSGMWSQSFGPATIPGTSVIFDPDNFLSSATLASLSSNSNNGTLSATPAVRVATFTATPGQLITLSASGAINCCNGTPNTGPNGYLPNVDITSLGGISGYTGPGFALLGVFTNGTPPDAAPPNYDNSTGTNQAPVAPLLNQVFFVGDGLNATGSGSSQSFVVPDSATELWLGIADTYVNGVGSPGGYGDNTGSFVVSGAISMETIVANFNGGADQKTNATGSVVAAFPLGSNFTMALLDKSDKAVPSKYSFSDASVVGELPENTLFPNTVAFQYITNIMNRGSFHAAHLGTVTLKISPSDTSAGISPVTVTVTIIQPQGLGSTHPEVDALVYPVANVTGIPPDFIKAQMAQESGSAFDPFAYRYEPLNRWIGDAGVVSRGHDLRTSTFSLYRFATIKDSEDAALAQGINTDADDLATMEKFPCCGPMPTVLQIINNYDGTNNWTSEAGVGGRYAKLETDDFTAQTSLAASYGYMQLTYATAITTMHWKGINGFTNPTLLYDSTSNLLAGGGSLPVANQYLRKLFFQDNPAAAMNPELQFNAPSDLIDAFRPAWQTYNGKPSYPGKIIARIPTYGPVQVVPIF